MRKSAVLHLDNKTVWIRTDSTKVLAVDKNVLKVFQNS